MKGFRLRVRDRAPVIDDKEEGCVRVEGEMRRTATAVERCHQRGGAAAHARRIDQAAGKGVGALNVEGAPLVQLRLLHLHLCIRTSGGSMDR